MRSALDTPSIIWNGERRDETGQERRRRRLRNIETHPKHSVIATRGEQVDDYRFAEALVGAIEQIIGYTAFSKNGCAEVEEERLVGIKLGWTPLGGNCFYDLFRQAELARFHGVNMKLERRRDVSGGNDDGELPQLAGTPV